MSGEDMDPRDYEGQPVTTLSIAEVAQVAYTECVIRLDDLARDMTAAGKVLHAAKIRHQAAVAYRAAKAEQDDPEPAEVVRCGTCHGAWTCDWATHLLVEL